MKTLVTILFAGALSTATVMAGAIPSDHRTAARPAPRLPWRLYEKRPLGTRRVAGAATAATIGTPQLPLRLYQKQPLAAQGKPGNVKVASRIR
jgi:hypothetical protein